MKRTLRTYQVMSIVIGITALSVSSLPVVRAEADTPPAAVIRITPPAPVFDDAKRLEELAARRKQVAETIGPKSMLDPFIKAVQKHENYQPKAENVLMSAPSTQAATAGESSPIFQAADAKQASVYLLANPPANAQFESREYRQEQRLAAAWPKESGFN